MRSSDVARWASLVVPVLAALAASSVLLVDYTRPIPVFCDPGGGCDAVKRTAFAHVFGIPTPAFGVIGFVTLGTLALLRGPKVRIAHLVASLLGALVACALVVVQVSMKQFCPYCMVTDISALVLLGAVIVRFVSKWDLPEGKAIPLISSGLVSVALVVPAVLSVTVKPKLPKVILAELEKTPKGKITVIDFADFECPWCRLNHEALAPLLAEHASEVRLVRKQVPLMMHAHAMPAAKAALCAEKLGKGDEMAEELFTVEPTELGEAGCEKLATAKGLDLAAFRACVKDPATEARILADKEDFKASGGHGLPTVWIGAERLDGANDREHLAAAFERALAHK
jgi:uncharacterized membrane protein/predicted DsbA family dithiol-disulfide isomerase